MQGNNFFSFTLSILLASFILAGCTVSTTKDAPVDNPEIVPDVTIGSVLDLSNQDLTALPEYVFSKTNIEELDVSHNSITGAIQAEIRHLQKLKVLNLSNNNMTGLPAEIGQLQDLEVLNVSNNQLTGLPYEIGNLQRLKVLNISGNEYSAYDLDIIVEKLPSSCNIIK
ncbi:MAG: leucine-rich repeat domain-containing protein [Patescibacteria group bacterium]